MEDRSNSPSPLLESFSDAIVQVVQKVAPSVVRVGDGHRFGGSAVVWSSDGYVTTASHVLGRLSEVNVDLQDGRSFVAKVVGRDLNSDVALLRIDADNLTPIQKADSERLSAGQFVLAFANMSRERPAVTSGIITNPKQTLRGWWGRILENMIVTDAPLNPGYSGGPLVDAAGRMIGLDTAFVSSRGLAVPVDSVKYVVERLGRDGKVKRAYFGVVSDTISLPEDLVKTSQIEQDEGLIVLSVASDSPAKKAGLVMGDIIVKLNREPVTNVYDLRRLLTEEIVGKPTSISILRAEKLIELSITPAESAE